MGKIYAVAGNPVLHSKSPEIFNEAFRAVSPDAVYTRIAASGAGEIIDIAKEAGICGLNVTSPFKEEIIRYLDGVEEDAKRIKAVNTVVREGGRFIGYNTDCTGVVDALQHSGIDAKGKRAVVLGASGAGRAAVFGLLSSGAQVTVINRTYKKAAKVAGIFGCTAATFGEIGRALPEAHILISCISSPDRIVDPSLLRRDLVVLDANYSLPTALSVDAQSRGCRIVDGREWLLFQALPAFKLFTEKEAPVEIMRSALYRKNDYNKRNISLIGFMGTGKTTVGKRLAEYARMKAVDMDKSIENDTGLSIREIFGKDGEEAFRSMERREVSNMENVSNIVFSCGGGVVLDQQNVDTIRSTSVPVWLWAKIGTILDRVGDGGVRPLLNGKDREARARDIHNARLHLYARTADMLISTEDKNPEEIVKRICDEIHISVNR
ncbi:MAG: Shikimate dehydrogenase [Syntrophorhabdus sp. PtaU1.Bin058]|nr:MAG: Shikimate dehydrogenase [Syntrophorhabdus sp. PtaU1.Bin058]